MTQREKVNGRPGPTAVPIDAIAARGSASMAAWVTGSDAPEKSVLRIGFMALSDCASVVMASLLGFDQRHGITIVPVRVGSWAAVRDKLLCGQIDLAHVPYGLVYGVHLGIGGAQQDMAVLMTLNRNGQGLTLSRPLADRGAVDAQSLAALMAREPRDYRFAQTFPTGTHAMWLYYWMAAAGIHPMRDARDITVPPPQMVEHLRRGHLDGFSAGEPWNQRAIVDGVGVSVATSQDVWPDHPEKVLGCTAAFVRSHRNSARAATMAVLEASRWIDASVRHRRATAEVLAREPYVDTAVEAIAPRLLGHYDDGLGRRWRDARRMRFHADGEVNFPYLSDGMWFLTQHKRWGLLRVHPDYLAVAQQINQTKLYAEAATALGIAVPALPKRRSRLIDGVIWDGSNPRAYADAFALRCAPHAELHAA